MYYSEIVANEIISMKSCFEVEYARKRYQTCLWNRLLRQIILTNPDEQGKHWLKNGNECQKFYYFYHFVLVKCVTIYIWMSTHIFGPHRIIVTSQSAPSIQQASAYGMLNVCRLTDRSLIIQWGLYGLGAVNYFSNIEQLLIMHKGKVTYLQTKHCNLNCNS
jgi:hypothetical protein